MQKYFILFILFFVGVFSKQNILSEQSLWQLIPQFGDLPFAALDSVQGMWDGSSAFDNKRNLFYIFSGINSTYPTDKVTPTFSVFNVETFTWTNLLSSDTPAPRSEAMLWVEKKTGNVYLSGGRGVFRRGLDLTFNDTNVYDVNTKVWSQVAQTLDQEIFANRSGEAKVVGKKAYAYSGTRSTLSSFINRPNAIQSNVIVWEANSGWQNVNITCLNGTQCIPTPRGHHHLCYNGDRDSLFTYGGYTKDSTGGTSTFSPNNYLSDLWEFDLGESTWTQHIPASNYTPGLRDNGKFVFCNKRALYFIGGSDYNSKNYIDLWRYDLQSKLWSFVPSSALLDQNNIVIKPPTPIGSYYFTRKDNFGNHQFWIFSGSSSEFSGLFESKMYRLTVTNEFD